MFIYAIKSAIVLSLLYLPYLLMLRHESFFRFNRMMLCMILLTALMLPACNLPMLSLDSNPVVNAAQQQMIEVGIPIAQGFDPEVETVEETQQMSWFAVVATLYIIVAVALLVLRLRDYVRLQRIIRHDCLWHKEKDGITIYCHAEEIPPFSWGRTIVIGQEDYEKNGACIVRHERGHIISGHSLDIVLLTAVQLLQWFNPLVWLLGQSLQDVHEYEADDYVLQSGITLDEYRYLLIQKAVGASPYVFANNFNHSLLKKRIKMMCQKKSGKWQRAKALYAIPVALLSLSAFATPEFEKVSKAIDEYIVLDGEPITKDELNQVNPADIESISVLKGESATAVYGDKGKEGAVVIATKDNAANPQTAEGKGKIEMAKFRGNVSQWVSERIRYPKEALEFGETGRIYVHFTIEADGSVTEVSSIDPEVTAEELAEVQVVRYAPDFKGLSHEDSIALRDVHGVDFHDDGTMTIDGKPVVATAINSDAHKGEMAAKISLRRTLQDEAERVVKSMPAWEPSKQGGRPVRSRMTIPITFRLQ